MNIGTDLVKFNVMVLNGLNKVCSNPFCNSYSTCTECIMDPIFLELYQRLLVLWDPNSTCTYCSRYFIAHAIEIKTFM